MDWAGRLAASEAARDAAARRRMRRTVTRRDGMRCVVDGRTLLNFCSNDYLGVSQHPAVVAALRDAAAADGVGSTASHLVCGHHALHDALEREVADWLEAPRALLFGSGFSANLAVLQALLQPGDVCLQDRLNHASLIDGARLSGAALRRYPHLDVEAAARQLRAALAPPPAGHAESPDRRRPSAPQAGATTKPGAPSPGQPAAAPGGDAQPAAGHATRLHDEGPGRPLALIATDGVFSMDGDVAPLRELAALAGRVGALLHVDDAHGVGLRGPQGRGSVAADGLSVRDVPLQLVTLGKALGTQGALVVGDDPVVRHLAETARGYVYTTALAPPLAAAALAAVRLARAADDRRARLAVLIARFRERAGIAGLELLPSDTPIQAVMAHDDRRALAMSRALEDAGLWVSAIRPPTVPEGRARLRVTLTALHTEPEVDRLVDALAAARDAAPAPTSEHQPA